MRIQDFFLMIVNPVTDRHDDLPVLITFLRKFYNQLIINISVVQCGCPEFQLVKENSHGQALAPNGALSLNLRDSFASKLAGYPVGRDSPLRGVKPAHDENCRSIKLPPA